MKRSCRNVQETCSQDLLWQPQITTDKKIDDHHGSSTMMAFSGSAPPSFALRFGAGLPNIHERMLEEDSVSMIVQNVVFFILITYQLFVLLADDDNLARHLRVFLWDSLCSFLPSFYLHRWRCFVPCCLSTLLVVALLVRWPVLHIYFPIKTWHQHLTFFALSLALSLSSFSLVAPPRLLPLLLALSLAPCSLESFSSCCSLLSLDSFSFCSFARCSLNSFSCSVGCNFTYNYDNKYLEKITMCNTYKNILLRL